jgi:hypothetical protein
MAHGSAELVRGPRRPAAATDFSIWSSLRMPFWAGILGSERSESCRGRSQWSSRLFPFRYSQAPSQAQGWVGGRWTGIGAPTRAVGTTKICSQHRPPNFDEDAYVQNGGTVTIHDSAAQCLNLEVGGVADVPVPVPVVGRESTVAVYTALTVGGTLEVGGAGGELSCTGRPRVINYRKRRQRYGSPSLRCQFPICFRDGCTRSVVLALEEVADRSADGRTSVEAHREGG